MNQPKTMAATISSIFAEDLLGALQADNDELAQLGTAEESLGVSIARSREMSAIIVTCWRVEHESFFGNELGMMCLLGQVWDVVQALLDVFCCFERCLAWGSIWNLYTCSRFASC